jgi:hypothetical protein
MTISFQDVSAEQLVRMFDIFVRSAAVVSSDEEPSEDEIHSINDESTALAQELGLM